MMRSDLIFLRWTSDVKTSDEKKLSETNDAKKNDVVKDVSMVKCSTLLKIYKLYVLTRGLVCHAEVTFHIIFSQ